MGRGVMVVIIQGGGGGVEDERGHTKVWEDKPEYINAYTVMHRVHHTPIGIAQLFNYLVN